MITLIRQETWPVPGADCGAWRLITPQSGLLADSRSIFGRDWQAAALLRAAEPLIVLMGRHDSSTRQHMQQVGALLLDLIEVLNLSAIEAQWIVLAGWLHDIGKLAIPENILVKPGALTLEEWALMRTHPIRGAEIVSRIPNLRPLAPLIRAHHEHWDGQGYPDRLAGQEIPFGARLIAVADAYLAMTEERPYRQACMREMALEELHRCAGTQFDPQIVAALARLVTADLAIEVA